MPRTRQCNWWVGNPKIPCLLTYGHAGPHEYQTKQEKERSERYYKAERTAHYEVLFYLGGMGLEEACQRYPEDVRPDIRTAIEGVIEGIRRSSLGELFEFTQVQEDG